MRFADFRVSFRSKETPEKRAPLSKRAHIVVREVSVHNKMTLFKKEIVVKN